VRPSQGPGLSAVDRCPDDGRSKVAAMKTRVVEYSKRYAEQQAAASAVPQVERSIRSSLGL